MFRKSPPPNFKNDKVNSEGSRVIAVSFASQTKTILDGFQPKFANKDSILISNGEALDTCEVKVDGKGATITTNLTGPLTAVYPYTAAKMNESNLNQIDTVLVSTVQSGKFADANICMAKMTDGKDESLSFENKTALFKIIPGAGADTKYVEVSADGFEIANDVPTGSTHTSLETIHVSTTTADSVWVSILVPGGLKVSDLTFSDGTNEKVIPAGNPADKEIAAGTLYTVTKENWKSPEADIPEPLKGVFTVADPDGIANSGDEIKVHFSRGNLYAKNEGTEGNKDWKWHFYDKQYQYNSNATSSGSRVATDEDTEIDLFTWGYDGTLTNASYSLNPINSKGITGHDTEGNKQLNPSTGGDDWGVAYCNSNNIAVGTWRTLSTAEWQYLFNTRTFDGGTGDGHSYQRATINSDATSVYGMILYPDNYSGTANASYTSTEWTSLEEAGCVFLPAAGGRISGSHVDDVGGSGTYWSSSAGDENKAYCVSFSSDGVGSYNKGGRGYGFSVRLVTNVSAAPAPTAPEPDYVEITAKYDGEDQPARALKWATKNLAITDSGNKSWKGGSESAVKVPGTDEDVIVGDYFQWAASYAGYNITSNPQEKDLLLYTSFENKKCGDANDKFYTDGGNFSKSFNNSNAPYGGTSYSKYNSSSPAILERTTTANDDVANIILGDNWRMPTTVEFQEMRKVTYWAWDATDCGYYVFKPGEGTSGAANGRGDFNTSTDDKSKALLFFPAAGDGSGTGLNNAGSYGYYWSSSLDLSNPNCAFSLLFDSSNVYPQSDIGRFIGFSVRPVSDL